jgi:hypothetical protein
MDRLGEIFSLQAKLIDRLGTKTAGRLIFPESEINDGQENVCDIATLSNHKDSLCDIETGQTVEFALYEEIQQSTRKMIAEASEILDWTPWKPWSKQLGNKSPDFPIEKHFSEEHLREIRMEVVDQLHFVIEAAQILGMSSDDLYQMYLEKNGINHQRQDSGKY